MNPINISEVTPNDLPLIKQLQPANWGDIMPNMRFYSDSGFCYLIKAVVDDKVLGCGAVILHENCAWLANIIVDEASRGQGIGSAITKHLLAYAEQRRESVILIATKFGYPIYKKLGFMDDEEYIFLKDGTSPSPDSEHIIPYHEKYKDQVLDIDYKVTGEKRGQLLNPRLHEGFVYVKNETVEGFTIPALGEGLTLAYTSDAGIALMKKNLETKNRVALVRANKASVDFALSHDFKPIDDLYAIKMYKGKRIAWNPLQTFGRIGGNMG